MGACMSVYHVCAMPMEARGVHQIPLELELDCCEPCGCWEQNPGPLEEQLVLVTQVISPAPKFLSFTVINTPTPQFPYIA